MREVGGRQRPVVRTAHILSAAGICVVVTLGTLASMPMHTDAEIRALGERASREFTRSRTERCERPVLRGEPVGDDGTSAFRALLADDGGTFAACHALVRARYADVGDACIAPPNPDPPADHETHLDIGTPIDARTTEIESEILAVCRGFDVEAQRVAAHASVCSPWALGAPVVNGEPPGSRFVWALGVFARDRFRRGDERGGFELLLDAIRLSHDLARGFSGSDNVGYSTFSAELALRFLQGLAGGALALDEDALRALESQSRVLGETIPTFFSPFAPDRLAGAEEALRSRGWVPPPLDPAVARWHPSANDTPTRDRAILDFAEGGPAVDSLCDHAATSMDCQAAIEGAYQPAPSDEYGIIEFGTRHFPRLVRGPVLDQIVAEWIGALPRYHLAQALHGARILAIPVVFAYLRLTRERCIDAATLQQEIDSLDLTRSLAGSFEATESPGAHPSIEVLAPNWMVGADRYRVRPRVYVGSCPRIERRPPTEDP